jgi:serine O-acetyltransferase
MPDIEPVEMDEGPGRFQTRGLPERRIMANTEERALPRDRASREAGASGDGRPVDADARAWPVIPSFRELRSCLSEDYRANRSSFWSPGFQAVAAYRINCWRNGIRSRLARLPVTLAYNLLSGIATHVYGIELPPRTRIGRRLQIAHQHGIVVHGDTVLGDDCLIRHGVTIGSLRPGRGILPPMIGDRVEIGAGAVLIGPIRIGDDVVIGPNAVVTTDVPSRHTVYPPPPQIRERRPRRDAVGGEPDPHPRSQAASGGSADR